MGTQTMEIKQIQTQYAVPNPQKLFWASAELSALYGVSLRQLQYWDERGWIVPVKTKHKRWYTAAQAIDVGIAKSLVSAFKFKGFGIMKRIQAQRNSYRYLMVTSDGWLYWSKTHERLIQDWLRQSDKGLGCLLIDRNLIKDKLIKT